jgi:hypothetical protein
MKKMIYTAIYIVCFVATIFIYGGYQKKLIVLGFNNEKILGEITYIENIHRPRSGSYNKIYYVFDFNGEKYTRSITKNTGGLSGIINGFNSLLMNRHYKIGQKIQVLYNDELKFSYLRDELSTRIILIIILIIFLPLIALITIIEIKSILIEYLKKIKNQLIYKNKMKFYIQDNNYKIKESTIDGIFDYKKLMLKRLIDGTILCYGIKKGNNFIELSYFNNNYIFRIYKNGDEKEIINDENKNIKEYFEELVNGL